MENSLKHIKTKLNVFFRKYYTSMLLRGGIIFLAVGGLYFLITVAIEYFFWLSPTLRTILFWIFIATEVFLFSKFVILPLLYLFKLRKGLDETTASKLIGSHFPEIDDKLINLLQLSHQPEKSELLLASIEKRSLELEPIPFQNAVNLTANLRYLKYLALPLAIVLLVWLSGKAISFKDSYKRMVDHKTAYAPPAPFHFEILNDSLKAIEGVPFKIRVTTVGTIQPETIQIEREGELSYMQPDKNGIFEFTVQPDGTDFSFNLVSNEVNTGPFYLKILPAPTLLHFEMFLDYPGYTGKKDETLQNTGNARIPEGTKVTWDVRAKNTEKVELLLPDTLFPFERDQNKFKLYQTVYKETPYAISSSNSSLKRFEELGFKLHVVKDSYPKITTQRMNGEENLPNIHEITGEISDDYGFSKLELIYYPENDPKKETLVLLSRPKGNIDKFRYLFPANTTLDAGKNYYYYFRVTDNDGLRAGGKSSKSAVYSYYNLPASALKEQQLNRQKEQIEMLDKNMQQMDEQKEQLEELKDLNRQKNELNYNDKRRIENFLSRQHQQEQLMKEYTQKLKKDLEEFPGETPKTDQFNELLQERLERQQQEIEKNERLLEQLKEYTDKLEKQELEQKLDELAKNQQNNKRSLEQVLELTKRYYVQTRAANLRESIAEQAAKQDSLSQTEHSRETEIQKGLNEEFEKTSRELRELEKENDALKKPMDLGTDKSGEEEIKQEQKDALEQLNTPSKESQANTSQKKAAQKLRKMAAQMQSTMSMENSTTLNEDMIMLRQILDNLLKFTFDQEDIMETMNTYNGQSAYLPEQLKNQNDLRQLFEHIDDSLFALSLRRPELGEVVNTNLTEVYYNIDKSLEQFTDNQYYQGITHQQYTLTAANNLADFLSNLLDSMQNSMMGQGSGQESFQLPDIIQSQEDLNRKMQQGMQKSQGKDKEGEKEGAPESGKGKQGEGESTQGQGAKKDQGQGEQYSEELFEIFKQQQLLRQALEQQLENIQGEAQRKLAEQLLLQMERTETDLLNGGYKEQTLRRMQTIRHQLMQLEQAEQLQGEKSERKSNTNRKEFTQNSSNQSPDAQESFQELEILQRQVLPLREIYKQKVQRYFKGND